MTTLEAISKYIAESSLGKNEIYQILHDFMSKRLGEKFLQGWSKRHRMSVRLQAARRSARRKIVGIEEDLDLYWDTDFSRPVSPETLVARGDDIVEVKFLIPGDIVVVNDQEKVVNGVMNTDEGIFVVFK